MNNSKNVTQKLEKVFIEHHECGAVYVNDTLYSYKELYSIACSIRNVICQKASIDDIYIGVFCYKSIYAYAGIAGILMSGYAYLPLNPYHPSDKIREIIDISSCNLIILSEECVEAFSSLIDIETKLTIICPDPGEGIKSLRDRNKKHKFIFPDEFPEHCDCDIKISEDDPAYLIFTSGSTGKPKGIPVTHKNLLSYSNYIISKYHFNKDDRISQAPDISFDLSVHDLFVAFLSGACLYVVPKKLMMAPGKFIKDHKLTSWVSVPSVAIFMSRMKILKPNSFPSIRCSLFCGEGLPCDIAEEWQLATPNAILDNLYGPSEATVAFTGYRWDQKTSKAECVNGLVPIGKPFEGLSIRIIMNNVEVLTGEIGELYLRGSQVVSGYYKDKIQTDDKFVTLLDNKNQKWYRTGDLVKKIDNGNLVFMGRLDDQLQIRGYRVELLEIDKALKDSTGNQMSVSIPVLSKDNTGVADDIVGFIEGNDTDYSSSDIIKSCKSKLPDYMVPSRIIFIKPMPLNANGKIDKRNLSILLRTKYNNDFNSKFDNSPEKTLLKLQCCSCLKTLHEDGELRGPGLIKIINHQGYDDYLCHICLKGF